MGLVHANRLLAGKQIGTKADVDKKADMDKRAGMDKKADMGKSADMGKRADAPAPPARDVAAPHTERMVSGRSEPEN
jgi:hypothetical protein